MFTGVAGAVLSTCSLLAETLYVPNGSFESPATPFISTRIDLWQKAPQPSSFDTNTFGSWDNLAGIFLNTPATNADHIDNADGNQLAYLFSYPQAAIFQDYSSTDWSNSAPLHAFNARFIPGKAYTLTFGVTSSSQEPLNPGATLQVSLYYRNSSGSPIIVASNTVTYATNVFTNLTRLLNFQVSVPAVKATDAWASQYIGIQFLSTVDPSLIGGVWDLDNVRLTESIAVPNGSFESPSTQFVDPRIDSWQKAAQPASFDTNIFGAWDNLAGVFLNTPATNTDHIKNCDGNQLAYMFSYPQMGILQDYSSLDWSNSTPSHAFNAQFEPGKAYTLTLGVTSSTQEPLNPGATLLASLYYRDNGGNMITVGSTTITYSTNVFTNLTYLVDFQVNVPAVKPGDPWAGQKIGIQILSTVDPTLIGGVWDLDNVRLTEVLAPQLAGIIRTNNQSAFSLLSEPGLAFEILATPDVRAPASNWMTLGTITNVTGTTLFTDPATNLTQRYYRAHQLF